MASEWAPVTEATKSKGVRVACDGEIRKGAERFTECDISEEDGVFTIGEECQISRLVGIPILALKIRPPRHYGTVKDAFGHDLIQSYEPNETMMELMASSHPKANKGPLSKKKLFQKAKAWSTSVGSTILVRADRTSLYKHHVKAILDFKSALLSDEYHAVYLRHAVDPDCKPPLYFGEFGYRTPPAADIVELMEPGEFKDWYMSKRQWKHDDEGDLSLAWLPSPWASGAQEVIFLKRNTLRLQYNKLDHREKARNADHWKETTLLGEIHQLKRRLGEAEGELEIGGKKAPISIGHVWTH